MRFSELLLAKKETIDPILSISTVILAIIGSVLAMYYKASTWRWQQKVDRLTLIFKAKENCSSNPELFEFLNLLENERLLEALTGMRVPPYLVPALMKKYGEKSSSMDDLSSCWALRKEQVKEGELELEFKTSTAHKLFLAGIGLLLIYMYVLAAAALLLGFFSPEHRIRTFAMAIMLIASSFTILVAFSNLIALKKTTQNERRFAKLHKQIADQRHPQSNSSS